MMLKAFTERYVSLGIVLSLVCYTVAQSCESGNDTQVEERRKQTIRANILAQLNLRDDPSLAIPTTIKYEESQTILQAYYALRNASLSLERERERVCKSQEFFAKPVTSFAAITPSPLALKNGSSSRRSTRATTDGNLLYQYPTINFNFDLPVNRSDISRADLLLFQVRSNADDNKSVVLDQTQYVEVNAFASSIGIRTTAEGRYVDVTDGGYQVFDITSTVKLWVANNVKGLVTFEVTVFCQSSATCNLPTKDGKKPRKVEFLTDTTQLDTTPRIITISNSVTESNLRNSRRKRQSTQISSGVGYCEVHQSTCCLKSLTINFKEDLGFNFIVQPPSFIANYCAGVCPRTAGGDRMTPTLYEFLSHLSTGNPGSSVQPCCAGNTYLPLEILIRYDGQLVIEELQQVTVTSCRCT